MAINTLTCLLVLIFDFVLNKYLFIYVYITLLIAYIYDDGV